MIDVSAPPSMQAGGSPLVERERQCLDLLAQGFSDAEIAARLGISGRTVRFHVTNAKVKLKAKNRIHAVCLALRTKLL